MAFEFTADEPVREAIVRCAAEQLDEAIAALSEQISDDPVAAVHTARKAVKKERSLLRLTREAMPAKRRRRENAALRDAARGLSAARDAEVMLQTIAKLADRHPGQVPEHAFAAVREPLEHERDQQRSELVGSTLGATAVQELGAVRVRVGDWRLRTGGWDAIEPGLERTYRRGRRGLREARRDRSPETLHAWRKRVKDLWYQERLLAAVGGPAVRGQAKDLDTLSDLLGDDHDLAVLRGKLATGDVRAAADVDAIVGLIDHRREELQNEALLLGDRVYSEKPRAFARRLRACWRAGRALAAATGEQDPTALADATRHPHHPR